MAQSSLQLFVIHPVEAVVTRWHCLLAGSLRNEPVIEVWSSPRFEIVRLFELSIMLEFGAPKELAARLVSIL